MKNYNLRKQEQRHTSAGRYPATSWIDYTLKHLDSGLRWNDKLVEQ